MKSVTTLCLLLLAAANAVIAAPSKPRVERFDPTHVIITWTAKSPVDVYVSERPDADRSHAALLSGANHDGRYMATLAADRRAYFLLRDVGDGKMVRVAERILPLEQASNFRDVGGYPAAGGKHVRWGLIYRSAATPLLSDHDIVTVRAVGLAAMIDLRSTEERQLAPTRLTGQGIRYIAIDYPFHDLPDSYLDAMSALAPQYRAIFRELLSHAGPISYNCTAGQDRTGIATALILSALGVPRESILQDYHLSTGYRHPQYEVLPIDPEKYRGNAAAPLFAEVLRTRPAPLYSEVGRSYLAELFDQIDAKWGSVEHYLKENLDVGPAQLATLQATYLE
jgi:protein-tyrosine phosphatase